MTLERRRICFVTGTRAEFGLMRSTLRAIEAHRKLTLQLIVTGMHLDRSRGMSIREIRREGWHIDATVPWRTSVSRVFNTVSGNSLPAPGTPREGEGGGRIKLRKSPPPQPSPGVPGAGVRTQSSQPAAAIATGRAIASLASAFEKLETDVVLVTGDRVEALAAASAGHLSGRIVAHVHGGDRALGLIDDSLRHAISKLAHIHFPATEQSAERLRKMGEDPWRVFRVGSPGLDDVRSIAASRAELAREFQRLMPGQFALLVLHPQSPDDAAEQRTAMMLISAMRAAGFPRTIIVYPNNDPGSAGIVRAWDALKGQPDIDLRRNLPRGLFLGLIRDSAALIGNSSSGIIEAASFGTTVLDVGDRQSGRERGPNVIHAPTTASALRKVLARLWNKGNPPRFEAFNLYGSGNVGARIANTLARSSLERFRRKLIAY